MVNAWQQFIVSDREGSRLDQWLTYELNISRSQVSLAIKEGRVLVNKARVKAGYAVKHGDEIAVVIPPVPEIHVCPEAIPLDIVYEDEELVVINKPKDLVVHPAAGNWSGTLVNALLYHFQNLSSVGGELRPGIVHRLDKDTSGLMVVAKNNKTHQFLAQQLKERTVKRHYLGMVHGVFRLDQGIIEAPIGRHPQDRKKMAVVSNGRPAVTEFIVQRKFTSYSLVECRLRTGRTHQIRVHLASIGHPLVGDVTYGVRHNNLGVSSQALHAFFLAFHHPKRGTMEFRIPPSPELSILIEKVSQIV